MSNMQKLSHIVLRPSTLTPRTLAHDPLYRFHRFFLARCGLLELGHAQIRRLVPKAGQMLCLNSMPTCYKRRIKLCFRNGLNIHTICCGNISDDARKCILRSEFRRTNVVSISLCEECGTTKVLFNFDYEFFTISEKYARIKLSNLQL